MTLDPVVFVVDVSAHDVVAIAVVDSSGFACDDISVACSEFMDFNGYSTERYRLLDFRRHESSVAYSIIDTDDWTASNGVCFFVLYVDGVLEGFEITEVEDYER